MPAILLTLIKSKTAWGIALLLVLLSTIGVLKVEDNLLKKDIVVLKQQLVTEKGLLNDKTKALDLCSKGTSDLKNAEQDLSTKLKKAQADSVVKAHKIQLQSEKIAKMKPQGSSDYESANDLINSVIGK